NGNSFKPVVETTTDDDGTSTTRIPGPVTNEEKAQKKNAVKARSMLLMALPNEHLMTFNQYKDAKTLFAAIETRFGRNESTKKTQKTLLKQLYENFSTISTESLDLILTGFKSLNKSDLDTIILDDLYNNFKIVKQEVRGTTSTNTSSESMAFVSSPSPNSTNEATTDFKKTGKKITINGSDTVGYDKAKVECFNYHKMGHSARKCRVPRNQENKTRNQETTKKTINVEDISSKAMVAINRADYKRGLALVEEQLVHYKTNESLLNENIDILKRDIKIKDSEIVVLKNEEDKVDSPLEIERKTIEPSMDKEVYPTSLTSKSLMDDMLHLGEELKVMCDKKNSVLFTNTECFVLSPDFKLANENHVLLKVSRKNNMYNVDMKNIVPIKDLTCLVVKAINDESMLWHRRLGHINFKNINKLVKENLVRGTTSNDFAGKGASFDAGPSQDYILMPLWNDSSLFDSSLKNSDGDHKDNDGPSTESDIDNKERPNAKNSTKDVNTVRPSINITSLNINIASLTVNTVRQSDDSFGTDNDMRSLDGVEVDISNISTTYLVPTTQNTRIHKDHSLDNVIGDMQSGVQTRRMTVTTDEQGFISAIYKEKNHEDLHTCLFSCFLSQEEPKRITNALKDPAWGCTQEEGIDYDEVFAPVARIEAIRLFLAYASFMGFLVYQMDVKSAFLYGRIEEEVYVCQPLGFEDPDYPDKVYKVEKALYGLYQAPEPDVKTANTPMDKEKALLKYSDGDDVDVHLYSSQEQNTSEANEEGASSSTT
nr:hypothetical protein [Tanacetum cinerariifolium]